MHTGFLTIYWRDMLRFVRFRTLLFASLVQPALWLAFFGIAMSNNFERLTATIPAAPGVRTVGYLTFIGAGVIAMTTLFTSLFGGTVLLFDKNWGLMRETLSSPLPRIHIIIGIGLSAMTKSLIQASVIMGFGLLLGVQFFEGYTPAQTFFSLFGIMLFIGAFSLGFLFLSAAIAITMESPEGMQAVITLLTMPFFFHEQCALSCKLFSSRAPGSFHNQSPHASCQRDQVLCNRERFLVNRAPLYLYPARSSCILPGSACFRRNNVSYCKMEVYQGYSYMSRIHHLKNLFSET